MQIKKIFNSVVSAKIFRINKDKRCPFPILFWPVLLVFILLVGCSGNIIHLSYPTLREETSFAPGKNIAVCVVDFENKRENAAIGKRLNDESLLPRTPVERWLATGLAIELRNAGYHVTTAETFPEALGRGAAYIVTGKAEEVWLAETSFTRYTGTIRASISLLDDQGKPLTHNAYNCIYSKSVLPVYGVPQSLLDSALAEMLSPAVRLLAALMR